jgi:hypothetical protein
MGVTTSDVGYTAAMPRREDNEVHMSMWWHWKGGKIEIHRTLILPIGLYGC